MDITPLKNAFKSMIELQCDHFNQADLDAFLSDHFPIKEPIVFEEVLLVFSHVYQSIVENLPSGCVVRFLPGIDICDIIRAAIVEIEQ